MTRGGWRALLPVVLAASATACATTAAPATGPHIPAAYAPNSAAAQASAADQAADAKFAAFVRDFRSVALAQGIKPETYDRSMAGIARNPRVEQANLQQPEFVKPIWDYLDTAVSDKRVATGAQLLAADAPMLEKIHARFGVPPEYLVAIWGAESNYGDAMGHFNMFEALATLAYDGPRMDFGRKELIAAMKMEERENLDPKQMTSSWAGAFGQTQFVPSSFLANAVDEEGNGRIDLWHSPADALASTAFLLANAGWKDAQPWGFEVTLPAGFNYGDADIDTIKTVAEWKKLGVRKANGDALTANDKPAAIIVPAGAHGPAFMVFDDFKVVLKYNNAQSYALAVCLLADRIKGGGPVIAAWPREETPLTRDERIAFQNDLKKLGYDPGDIDGVLGHKVRAAIRAFQKANGIPADGFATEDLLVRLERAIAAKGG
ncbi:MAG TPA: lytic murein transglycosylase [Rhizomicrobium sp.]|nr:lytic murein transglycosylase [Rhizomicrobium sp.]